MRNKLVDASFAGLWSAVGAARKLDELGIGPGALAITLVNRDAYHCIRVRNYEADLSHARIRLDDVLGPVGIERVEGEVVDISVGDQGVCVKLARTAELRTFRYDRLIFALGSQLNRPSLPGLAEYALDVDTYAAAARLNAHLQSLPQQPESPGQYNVVVAGAGLTGIEAATEMLGKLRATLAAAQMSRPFRVILIDHKPRIGSDMGDSARPVIEEALQALGIETRTGVYITAIDSSGVTTRLGRVDSGSHGRLVRRDDRESVRSAVWH